MNAQMAMVAEITITGAIILTRDMPEDLNASSSRFSARFPKVIRLARSTARGRAMGTRLALVYSRNSEITFISRPFPIRSSIYFQRNCIRSIKMTKKNVSMNGPIKDFMTSI
jgi:hypothetical protein